MSRHVPRHTFPCPPPPPSVSQVTQVTQVPITLTQHDTAAAPCDTTHPMWRHRGTARPEPPPPPPPPPWLGKLQWLNNPCCIGLQNGEDYGLHRGQRVFLPLTEKCGSGATLQHVRHFHQTPMLVPHIWFHGQSIIQRGTLVTSHACHTTPQKKLDWASRAFATLPFLDFFVLASSSEHTCVARRFSRLLFFDTIICMRARACASNCESKLRSPSRCLAVTSELGLR